MNDTMTVLPDIILRFNIKHPSIEECYLFGYDCSRADISEEDNPFKVGSIEHEHWMEGWWAGFYGEAPVFDSINEQDSILTTEHSSANDHEYPEPLDNFFVKFLEISGVLVISAIVGYQLIELVA